MDKIKLAIEQILNRVNSVMGRGEEATKQALVLPLINALGYDIWNIDEVCPEYEADFAVKKLGQKEKVDFALLFNKIPRVYIEVKALGTLLDGHEGQLARYFNSTQTVTLAVLTNGIEWRFFTDTGDINVMDSTPFHILKLDSPDQGFEIISTFSKEVFSAEGIKDYATELLYTAKIAQCLRQEIDLKDRMPSTDFIRWILKLPDMYDGIVNQNVVDRFKPIVKAGLTRVIREIVRRSVSAMDDQVAQSSSVEQIIEPLNSDKDISESGDSNSRINTTDNELKIFEIIRDIFEKSQYKEKMIFNRGNRKEIPIALDYKDTTGYFGVYFNKPSWWVARIVAESKKPWIGFNISLEELQRLIPVGFNILPPHAFAECRVGFETIADLYLMKDLFYASFEKTLLDRHSSDN